MVTTPAARPSADDLTAARRAALTELVDATHRLDLAVATTDLGEDQLAEARRRLDEVADLLGERTRTRAVRGAFEAPARAKSAGVPYRLCAYTPWGLPFEVTFTEAGVHAHLTANALHEGPPDSVHGGIGAYLMDCLLGMLVQVGDDRAVTAHLEIDYLRRTPLDQPLDLHARLTSREGRKIRGEGWIEHEGQRTLEARALFIVVDGSAR